MESLGLRPSGALIQLLPHQAIGPGAPQMINRRPLPPPDRHNRSVHAVCSCGHSLGNTPWRTFNHRVFAVFTFSTFIQPSCVVGNVFIIFSHRSPRMLRFFSFFKTSFSRFLLQLYHGHQMVENLHLAID